jgi:hypothetical protein
MGSASHWFHYTDTNHRLKIRDYRFVEDIVCISRIKKFCMGHATEAVVEFGV